jgi:hypothetical protein
LKIVFIARYGAAATAPAQQTYYDIMGDLAFYSPDCAERQRTKEKNGTGARKADAEWEYQS